ncbi:MAG: hypothetical protein ACTS8R_09195, partial [Arsenophonus sp. NC-QC1-MAG3]
NELEIAQLSANNRQEIARLRIDIFKKRYHHTHTRKIDRSQHQYNTRKDWLKMEPRRARNMSQ